MEHFISGGCSSHHVFSVLSRLIAHQSYFLDELDLGDHDSPRADRNQSYVSYVSDTVRQDSDLIASLQAIHDVSLLLLYLSRC
jgi:hypothetical protein